MKNIFKAFLAIAVAAATLVSCQKAADELALGLSASETAVEFDGFNPQAVSMNVSADGDWYVYAPEWITVTPSHGTGNTTVTVVAEKNTDKYNELCAPRADVVAFCGGADTRFSVNVKQVGEPGLDATKYFKKITSKDDFDPAVPYLILFQLDNLQSCLNIGCGVDDNSYAYGYTTAAPAPDADGTITITRLGMAWGFDPVEGGYALRQPNGLYLYQSGTYANFYTTASISKASVWTVDFEADGTAKIVNISQGGRIFQYDVDGYKDFGTWPEVGKGYILPMLYKDSAPASEEKISVKEASFAGASATSATIAVTSNRTWKIRNHDDWVKSFTASGEGDGNIEITFDANTANESRKATFLVIGEETNFEVTLSQAGSYTSIDGVNNWLREAGNSVDYEATLTDAVVSYVNGSNAFIQDATAGVLLYKSGHGLKVGDTFNGKVTGKGTMYGGAPELTAWNAGDATKTEGDAPEPVELTIAALKTDFAKYESMPVLIKGVKFTDGIHLSDRNGKIEVGEDNIGVYAKVNNAVLIPTGSEGDLVAIPCYNGTTKQIGVWETAQFTATVTGGYISVKNLEITLGDEANLNATVNSGAAMTYTSSDETIATVDENGKVTAIALGEATITIKADAVEGYTAAEATCKVTVVKPEPKITIIDTNVPKSYGTDTEFTVNGKTFYATQVMKNTDKGGIQFKKSVNAYIANKSALGTKIKSIVISKHENQGFYDTNYVLYVGTEEKPAETKIAGKTAEDGNSVTFDLSAGNYTYFKLVNETTYTAYLGAIEIKFEEAE